MFYLDGKVCSALLTAAARGYTDIAKLLIDYGASIHVVDGNDETCLHKASLYGHIKIVELLIANGAQINLKSKDGCTPLYMAACSKHQDIALFLLETGAIMEPEIAVMLGDTELVKYYFDCHELDINYIFTKGLKKGESLFNVAIDTKNINLIRFFLDEGTNINQKAGAWQYSPLHIASLQGNRDICEFLIYRGADVNAEDRVGHTPLHCAVQTKHLDITELLLDCGSRIDALSQEGNTALILSSKSHDLRIINLLLDRGANANIKNANGLNALICAFQKSGGDEIVKSLVIHGADVNVQDRQGLTPLHIAVAQNNRGIVEFLLNQGAQLETE